VLRDADGVNDLPRQALAAIEHHDDGWERWERAPEIDPKEGRPLSYRGEVALEKVLVIWGDSIASARQHGPLAGWMVARHFLYLLKGSESNADGAARGWRDEMESKSATWLNEWQSANPRHTTEFASRAVGFLQLFDLLSLWLCCDCAISDWHADSQSFVSLQLGSPTIDLGTYQFRPLSGPSEGLMLGDEGETMGRRICVDPFPFDVGSLSQTASGIIVPKMPSMHWGQMAASGTAYTLAWEFVASPSDHG
jgi:hypothetical protein